MSQAPLYSAKHEMWTAALLSPLALKVLTRDFPPRQSLMYSLPEVSLEVLEANLSEAVDQLLPCVAKLTQKLL